MKKFLSLALIVFLLVGCGVTQKATDGSDGSDGANGQRGQEGRDFITPVLYSYSFDPSGILCTINNPSTTDIKISCIGFDMYDTANFIDIWVPAGNLGKTLQVVINGNISKVLTVSRDVGDHYIFGTLSQPDYAQGTFMNCSRLDNTDKNSYFVWYVNGIQREMFFCDTFKSE